MTLIFGTGKLLFLQALDFRTKSLIFGTVDNGSWRCWQAESAWYLRFQKKHTHSTELRGGVCLIPSDFVVHSFRPPMEEAMSRLWSQLG